MAVGATANETAPAELTLTTGQPVSFVIDLYHPKNVERTVVEEETRAAAPPTKFERARPARAPAPQAPPQARAAAHQLVGPPLATPAGFAAPPPASVATMIDAFGAAAAGASAGVDRGEFFEYRVASRLSIRRGGSAMVPLEATREGRLS